MADKTLKEAIIAHMEGYVSERITYAINHESMHLNLRMARTEARMTMLENDTRERIGKLEADVKELWDTEVKTIPGQMRESIKDLKARMEADGDEADSLRTDGWKGRDAVPLADFMQMQPKAKPAPDWEARFHALSHDMDGTLINLEKAQAENARLLKTVSQLVKLLPKEVLDSIMGEK